jgi:hypothetical protein
LNPFARRPTCPSGFVTAMSTAPAACAGVVAVIDVALATAMPVAGAPPIDTVAPATNPVPLIDTLSPPAVGPTAGAIADTVGAGFVDGGGCDGPAGLEPPQDSPKIVSAVDAAHSLRRSVLRRIGLPFFVYLSSLRIVPTP